MASSLEFKNYILEQLRLLDGIAFKKMMGEYLLYLNGILFGGIYDDRLLIKKTLSNEKYHMEENIPYEGAKMMYLVSDIDNADILKDIILDTVKDL